MKEYPEPEFDEEDDGLRDNCPACGHEYDEIDREYQICHLCKWNANPAPSGTTKQEE